MAERYSKVLLCNIWTLHAGHHVVHWSRWRALAVLIVATVLMACCADLSTENIEPMLTHSTISQVFRVLLFEKMCKNAT